MVQIAVGVSQYSNPTMKVFSKNNKHNKSTPLLHSLTTHIPPKPTKPPQKPKGITKVTSYKNKLAHFSHNTNIAMTLHIDHAQPHQYPKTERSHLQQTHAWRTEASVEVEARKPIIPHVPMLLSSISYKDCKSETNGRSSKGSIEKVESVVKYGDKLKPSKNMVYPHSSTTVSGKRKDPLSGISGFHSEAYLSLEESDCGMVDKSAVVKKVFASGMTTSFMEQTQDKENIRSNQTAKTSKNKLNYYKNTKINEYQLKPLAIKSLPKTPGEQREREEGRKGERESRLTLSRFEMGRKLGRGRFGSVYLALEKPTGMLFALKLVNWDQVKEEQMEDQILEEIKLQLFMNHPNILRMYGFFREGRQLVMVLEYADEKCLFSKLDTKLPEKEVAYYTKQMIESLKYCHSESILHRDLKPENILLCQGVAKLADFGWAAYAPKYKRNTFCGTLDYVPPQILKGKYYDQKVDIWSLGVLIFEMSTGKAPFETYSISQAHVESKTMTRILDGDLSVPTTLSPSLRTLIESILMTDPEQRPALEEIETSPWLQNYKEEGVEISREIWQYWLGMSEE